MAKLPGHSKNWGGQRPGAGRPIEGKTPTKKVSVFLPEHVIEALDKVAVKESTTRSRLIVELVEKGLKTRRRR